MALAKGWDRGISKRFQGFEANLNLLILFLLYFSAPRRCWWVGPLQSPVMGEEIWASATDRAKAEQHLSSH